MKHKSLILSACLIGTSLHAEGMSHDASVQSFTQLTFSYGFLNDPYQAQQTYVPLDDGSYAILNCAPDEGVDCYTLVFSDFGNATAYGVVPSNQIGSAAFADLTPIETRNRLGGDVFPLRDGAVITWRELWSDDSFQADYDMRIEVTCCEAPPANSIAVSDEMWVLTFHYDNDGTTGTPHGGVLVDLFDPALGASVSRQGNSWYEDPGETTTQTTVFTDITPIDLP